MSKHFPPFGELVQEYLTLPGTPKTGMYYCPICEQDAILVTSSDSRWACVEDPSYGHRREIQDWLNHAHRESRGVGALMTHQQPQQVASPQTPIESFSEFEKRIREEFVEGSAICPSLYMANIECVSDLEYTQGGEAYEPIAEFLGWDVKESQSGFALRKTIHAALIRDECRGDWQAKLSCQSWDSEKGKYGKAYKVPKGNGSVPYLASVPHDVRLKIAARYGVDVPSEGSFWEWIQDRLEIPIVLTEGAKKSLSLLSEGFVAIAFYGCNAAYAGGNGTPYSILPDIESFASERREFVLAFDQDTRAETRGRVGRAVRILGSLLQREGSTVRVTKWQSASGKGIDDVLKTKGVRFVEAIIKRGTIMPKTEVPESQRWGQPTDGDAKTSVDWSDVHSDNAIDRILSGIPNWELERSAATPEHHLYKYLFAEGRGDVRAIDGTFCRYVGGGWTGLSEEFIGALTATAISRIWKREKAGDSYAKSFRFSQNATKKSCIEFNRSALTVSPEIRESARNFLNFKNCTLDIRTKEIVPHSRERWLTTQLQCDYAPNAELPTDVIRWIDRTFGEGKLELIRAVIRYYADPSIPYGKFVNLIGPSGTGKGTFIRFLQSIHGEYASALQDMDALATPEGRQQYLTGRRLLAFPDLQGLLPNLGGFYELVDNGSLVGRRLYSSTSSSKRWDCRFILGSTSPFQFAQSDAGWNRRSIPLATRPRQSSEDTTSEAMLQSHMAAILSWALSQDPQDTHQILWNPDAFGVDDDSIPELRDAQEIASDSVKGFVDACLKPSEGTGIVLKTEVYPWYRAWCQATGRKAKEFSRFCAGMQSILPDGHRKKRGWEKREGCRSMLPATFWDIAPVHAELFVSHRFSPPGGETSRDVECVLSRTSEGGLGLFRNSAYTASKNLVQTGILDPCTNQNPSVDGVLENCTGCTPSFKKNRKYIRMYDVCSDLFPYIYIERVGKKPPQDCTNCTTQTVTHVQGSVQDFSSACTSCTTCTNEDSDGGIIGEGINQHSHESSTPSSSSDGRGEEIVPPKPYDRVESGQLIPSDRVEWKGTIWIVTTVLPDDRVLVITSNPMSPQEVETVNPTELIFRFRPRDCP